MYTSDQNGITTSGAVAQMGMSRQYSAKDTTCVANMRVPKKKKMR